MVELWNQIAPLVDASLAFLATIAVKAFLVLLLAAGINFVVLRRASASLRHLVWTSALAAVLLLPALTPLSPSWSVPGLRVPAPEETTVPEPGSRTPGPRFIEPAPTDDRADQPNRIEPEAPSDSRIALAAGQPTNAGTSRPAAGHAEKTELSAFASASPLATGALMIWILGFVAVTLWIGSGLARARALGRDARRISSGPAFRLLERLSSEMGLQRRVILLEGSVDAAPMTWGTFRPTILLPSAAKGWSSSRLRAVMLHELAHVRRHDCLTQLLARLACSLHWFNPLVWLAAARMRDERELACDDTVLRAGPLPSEYATHLLDLARRGRATTRPGAAVAMARSTRIGERVQAVLDASRRRGSPGRRGRASLLIASALLVLPLAGAVPADRSGAGAMPDELSGPAMDVRTPPEGNPVPHVEPVISGALQEVGALGCGWLDREGSSSASINIHDDRLRARLDREDCELQIDVSGEVRFNAEETGVAAMSRDGRLEIEERRGRRSRRLVIEPDAGEALERRWYVDGSERGFDTEARAWLTDMISVLYRRAGYQATARAERILEQRGAEGLMREISQIPGDHTKARYYTVLLSQAELEPERVRQIVARVGEEIDSDHALARLLIAIAENHPLDESVQAAYVEAASSLDSDHQHRRVLSAILHRENLSPEIADRMLEQAVRIDSDHQLARLLMEVAEIYPAGRALPRSYLNAARSIDSDHQLTRVLTTLLARDDLDAAGVSDLLELATSLDSDHQAGRLLQAVLEERGLEEGYRGSFFDLVDGLSSDHQRRRVLDAALDARPLSRSIVQSILRSALEIESDHEMSRLLVRVAERFPVHDDLRADYMRAVDSIDSEHQRRRALSALSRRGN